MRAALGIDALISQPQPFHRASVDQVLLDDLRGIFRLHMPVPDRLWINDNRRAMFALIQTSGLVNANRASQARRLRKLLKLGVQLALSIRRARGSRRAFRADVMAHKNVVFENWQT